MLTAPPSKFSLDLSEERLITLCDLALDTISDSIQDSGTEDDTAWTRGCLSYGRLQGLMFRLTKDKNYPWISLVNKTMDFTVRIGNTLIQFMIDDAFQPKKTHRLAANSLEDTQLSLLLESNTSLEVVTWRLFIGIDKDSFNTEPTATIVGYDINKNSICWWSYEDSIQTPISVKNTKSVEIVEPQLIRKQVREDVSNDRK
jgi:hypothetical protein